jgi:hypothetical protein
MVLAKPTTSTLSHQLWSTQQLPTLFHNH